MTLSQLLEQIEERASAWTVRRFVLGVLAAPLILVGLVAGAIWRAVWTLGTWLVAAVLVGFHTGRGDDQ